jgi:hypothetical protein
MQLAADTGLISQQEAITIARSRSNYINLCKSCNLQQGSKLMGNYPGAWPPQILRPDSLTSCGPSRVGNDV